MIGKVTLLHGPRTIFSTIQHNNDVGNTALSRLQAAQTRSESGRQQCRSFNSFPPLPGVQLAMDQFASRYSACRTRSFVPQICSFESKAHCEQCEVNCSRFLVDMISKTAQSAVHSNARPVYSVWGKRVGRRWSPGGLELELELDSERRAADWLDHDDAKACCFRGDINIRGHR
jgi:hypothetical protein